MIQLNLAIDDVFEHILPIIQETKQCTIIEIGAHDGRHSDLIRFLCRERPRYLAIEPDPRNVKVLTDAGHDFLPIAVSSESGEAPWFASSGITPGTNGRQHTDSSSLKRPTKHLEQHPWCEFQQSGTVRTLTLDTATDLILEESESVIDLVWADVQGAQLEVIRGGKKTLSRTRFLFIEVHPEPLYEGEPSLKTLRRELELLTESQWVLIAQYPADVLLKRVEK